MKKLLTAVLFICFLSPAVFTQPKITLNITGGYGLPLPDLKGNITDSADRENTYLMKTGFNAGITGKYAFDKKGKIRLTFGGSYNKFSVDDTYEHTNSVSIHSNINIITVNIGGEYAFSPKEKTNPFIGLDLTGNFFSGNYEEDTDTLITDHSLGTETATMKSASRFGIAVGGGFDVSLNKSFGAVFGFKYNFANLIGKEFSSTSAVGEYNLNDKEDGVNSAKNISYFQIYAGVSFYLAHPKKLKR